MASPMTSAFIILSGLTLFLYAINILSTTLKKIASTRLKQLLKKSTDNPIKGALTGTAVTFLVQSSSVTVLLLIGLVNAGIMNLRQAVYVILGSEIGTTITAQIVSFQVKLLFYPLIAVGYALKRTAKQETMQNCGQLLFSLGLIFLAMKMMADGAKPLKELPFMLDAISSLGAYPLVGILCGAVFTTITNSSSATTSLVIALSMEQAVDLKSGIALIIGANIGTCTLELIAAINTSIASRRTGMAQFLINIFGAVLFFPFLTPFATLIAQTAGEVPRQIANAHTIFNLSVSLLLLPFVNAITAILERLIPGTRSQLEVSSGNLDDKFLTLPSLALYEVEEEINRMAAITEEMVDAAKKAIFSNDREAFKAVTENEAIVDTITENLNKYIHKIKSIQLSNRDIRKKRAYVHVITDIERVADLAEGIAKYSQLQNTPLSSVAQEELSLYFDNAATAYNYAVRALARKRKKIALKVSPVEKQVDSLGWELKIKYMHRMMGKKVRPAADALYPDIIQHIKRIGAHSANIAEQVMKM